uniref:CSON004873 protein n=1 Tax=Culicoides sonorensis TaxID=179676 RepID=A0A336MQH9_CULSO
MSTRLPGVSARAFSAMKVLNIAELATYPAEEIRPILPSLARMTLLSPMVENTPAWAESRKQILSILVGVEVVNVIVALLQADYHEMEMEVKKEQQLRQKIGYTQQDSAQFHNLPNGVVLGFEKADVSQKVRIVLSELFYIQAQIQELNQMGTQKTLNEVTIKQSELFDNDIYLEEVSDIICIALPELPSILNVQELVDTLLYVNNGSRIICWIVANMPDTFKDVANALLTNGDDETPDGRLRQAALYALCEMNPGQALTIRTLCVEMLKMPSLALRLSLNDPADMISFVSGLLLGNDQQTRLWFAQFVRASQKRKIDVLQILRDELLNQLKKFTEFSSNVTFPDDMVVPAVALLKLYCALRGIAGIKYNDDETLHLMQLITSMPPLTPAGIRFVSVGLCMLIACPSLIAQPSLEAKGIEWIQKLIKDGAYFETVKGSSASFGEMLLLMAIHFHSNQLSNISELVCSTLGMKIPIRQNNTTRMKQIFVQEIFTEQVVAAHAIKVPVTPKLNANITGYLPVHCIHQLLKSRAFSKHKVKIKNWIYRQICSATTPLHPVLPSLIEAYVNSIIVPNAKGPVEHSHNPLAEQEIQRIFQDSRMGSHIVTKKVTYPFDPDAEFKDDKEVEEKVQITDILTAQLLFLYYLLFYEDVRLNNMVALVSMNRKVKSYSIEFLSELPIKYLLQQAKKNQHNYSGLFSALLKLLVTHFPHLSLVDDWIDEESNLLKSTTRQVITEHHITTAFEALNTCPAKTTKLLKLMLTKSSTELWPLAKTFIQYFKSILDTSVPRLIQKLYRLIWIRLNTVLPRRLWIMTIQALMPEDTVTKNFLMKQENLLDDPLQILRCDERVFRCADALVIVLRILQATLAASKRQLSRHILDKPLIERNGQLQNEQEREELRLALVASQESAAVQILLETCLETEKDQLLPGRKWALREIRGLICSYIHQAFISEPPLAKLVHFQGYPRELLPITVRGIPSMHICLDFIPELLLMAEMDKQIFAIDLASHLSLQYSLVRSMGQAKLCLNTLTTLLGVLSNDMRIEMFRPILPCIIRFGEAFPPLLDDCALFLMQLGRVVESQNALGRSQSVPALIGYMGKTSTNVKLRQINKLVEEIKDTFAKLLNDAVLKPKIY